MDTGRTIELPDDFDIMMPEGFMVPINAGLGFVKIVDWMGSDHSIDRAARVSTGTVARSEEAVAKLIDYLVANSHSSPMEHVVFTFHIKTLRAVMDEHMRHRTWSYNAQSQRYLDLTKGEALEGYIPPADKIGFQPPKGESQQGRTFAIPADNPGGFRDYAEYAHTTRTAIYVAYEAAYTQYRTMVKNGTPREVARLVLPMGLMTEYYATVDLWNLCHFIALRTHPRALWEIQEVARACQALARPIVPLALGAFERHHLAAVREGDNA